MIKSRFSKLCLNDFGNVAVITALLMPLLVAGAGFGAEVALWYRNDIQLQQTADKSAYATAIDLRAGASSNTLLSTALEISTANGFVPKVSTTKPSDPSWVSASTGSDNLVVSNPPTSGAYAGNANAIQVVLQKYVPLSFSALFISSPIVENVKAVALIQTASNSCVLALSPTASPSISIGGSASLNLTGCNVNSNSTASNSVSTSGSGTLSVDCIVTVGGVSFTSGSVSQKVCISPVTYTSPVVDPYASLATPTSSITWPNSNGATLQPGVYSNGLNLTGTKNLQPGVYIVTGGSVSVGANANITGSGVTIYVANGVDVKMNANGYVNLSAPTSGPYSGILFFGARDGTGSVTMNGTSASLLTGSIYFPNQNVSYLGNFSGKGGCTQVVAKTVSWSGTTSIAQDCTSYGLASIPSQKTVMLVE